VTRKLSDIENEPETSFAVEIEAEPVAEVQEAQVQGQEQEQEQEIAQVQAEPQAQAQVQEQEHEQSKAQAQVQEDEARNQFNESSNDTVSTVNNDSSASIVSNSFTDTANTKIVHVTHLTRPFTLAEFKQVLSQYGEIEDLWLDTLKSQSFVTFVDSEAANACVSGLNGKQFPDQTGKLLVVQLMTTEKMDKIKNETEGMTSTAIGATLMNTFSNSPESRSVPLEELFKKTEAEPSIYYLPKQQK
jgi:hypothetical protein